MSVMCKISDLLRQLLVAKWDAKEKHSELQINKVREMNRIKTNTITLE